MGDLAGYCRKPPGKGGHGGWDRPAPVAELYPERGAAAALADRQGLVEKHRGIRRAWCLDVVLLMKGRILGRPSIRAVLDNVGTLRRGARQVTFASLTIVGAVFRFFESNIFKGSLSADAPHPAVHIAFAPRLR